MCYKLVNVVFLGNMGWWLIWCRLGMWWGDGWCFVLLYCCFGINGSYVLDLSFGYWRL